MLFRKIIPDISTSRCAKENRNRLLDVVTNAEKVQIRKSAMWLIGRLGHSSTAYERSAQESGNRKEEVFLNWEVCAFKLLSLQTDRKGEKKE